MSTVFPEYERQLVQLARTSADAAGPGLAGKRWRGPGWFSLGVIVPVVGVLVCLAVIAGALVTLHGSPSGPGASGAASSLRSLLAQYAVLRRPQTAADRTLAGRPPVIGATTRFSAGSGHVRFHPTTDYVVRISGLSHYVAIPRLTRVVSADGVRVALFVERYVKVSTPPRVKITGNDHKGAEKALRGWLRLQQRLGRLPHPDLLVVRVAGQRARAIMTAADLTARQSKFASDLVGSSQVMRASFTAPGGKIVAVEPDGVTTVNWHWPREWAAALSRYLQPASLSADVSNNVAVTAAPTRFNPPFSIGPYTVTLDGPTGAHIGRYVDATNSPSVWLKTTPGSQTATPTRETQLSRKAERNPTTPNPVFLVPASVSLRTTRAGPGFMIEFRNLLNHASYQATVTDKAHRACVRHNVRGLVSYGAPLNLNDGGPTTRGTIFSGSIPVMLRCRGTYRVSVAVTGPHGKPYAPFGTATLTVR